MTLLLGLCLSGAIACTGVIDGGSRGEDAPGAGTPGGGGSGPGSVSQGSCEAVAPPLQARLLSPTQYDHTVSDLLGIESTAGSAFSEGGGVAFDLVRLDEVSVERLESAAETVADQAVQDLATVFPCGAAATPEDACVRDWISDLGTRAFRRPLADAELQNLNALFVAGTAEGNVQTGVQWLLTGVLQSPDFLYRIALNDPNSAREVRPLDGYELASRLSYFLWDSMPDTELFAAAESGELETADGRRVQAQRMLDHERFQRALVSFYENWLNLGVFAEVARDAPDFNQAVIDSLRQSVHVGIQELYAGQANVEELLLGTNYYMDSVLAGFYGVSTTSTGFSPVDLAHEGRRGITAHPALMTAMARPDQTFPIGRGLFVLEKLLCRHIAPLPGDVPPLPEVPEGGTERDQLEMHTEEPVCAACHSQIDPFGFAFQDFDEVGRLREGMDSSGVLEGVADDVDGPFANGTELMERLGRSATVRACFATQFFEFGLARHALLESKNGADEAPGPDVCSLEPIQQSFAETGDLRQLVVDIIDSPAFRHRLSEVAVEQ